MAGLFNKKGKEEDVKVEKPAKDVVVEKKEVQKDKKEDNKKIEKVVEKPKAVKEIKGGTTQAYRILVRPMVTEKTADMATIGKYAFIIDENANKIEVKKAIRSVYGVDPVSVNIANFAGKSVRYGRRQGKRKSWRKAVVTLRKGDKIEIYEGV